MNSSLHNSMQVIDSFDPSAILPKRILVDYDRVRNAPLGSSSVRFFFFFSASLEL